MTPPRLNLKLRRRLRTIDLNSTRDRRSLQHVTDGRCFCVNILCLLHTCPSSIVYIHLSFVIILYIWLKAYLQVWKKWAVVRLFFDGQWSATNPDYASAGHASAGHASADNDPHLGLLTQIPSLPCNSQRQHINASSMLRYA